MPYGARPVASLYKRADYKTEFDIFKQNTDLDLISLVSLEDDTKEQDFINRRCHSSRTTVKSTNSTQNVRNSYTRCASARYLNNSGINAKTNRKANIRTCKSAVSRFENTNYNNRIKTPRYKGRDQSSINKDTRTNVDFKCAKYTSSVQTYQRQVKSAYAPSRTRGDITQDRRFDSTINSSFQGVTNRVNSASTQCRFKTSSGRKPCKVGFLEEKESFSERFDKTGPGTKEEFIDCDEGIDKAHVDGNVNETNSFICKAREGSVESVDSGVVRDLSVRLSVDTDPLEKEQNNESKDDDASGDVSCCSIDGSGIRSNGDEETDSNCYFGLHDFINDLVDRDGVRSRLENVESSLKDIRSETESLFSVSTAEKEPAENKESAKEAVDYPITKLIQEPQDITMSKEAKSIIIETLHDLKDKTHKGDKENIDDNIRYKSVRKQKRMKENRSKYDHFMRERTESYIQLTSRRRHDRESDYEKNNDLYESEDEGFPSLDANKPQKFLPSISNTSNNKRGSHTCSSASSKQFYSLDQVKKRKYKIPGIGNYNLISSPDIDFEVTPPGFDCRYDARPILTKEELDPPPKCIQERSIQKCKKWLKNVNLSPLNLNPVVNKK